MGRYIGRTGEGYRARVQMVNGNGTNARENVKSPSKVPEGEF